MAENKDWPRPNVAADAVVLTVREDRLLTLVHDLLVGRAVAWLRGEVWRRPLLLDLMPGAFTLRQLQLAFEAVLGESLFRTTFRRRLVDTLGWIKSTGQTDEDDPRRPELFVAI